ncbi:MAG: energy transducer TonB [Methylococcaceae bacterium]|nr:energy transducer TonB [Methylococcaceae bacterium]
MYLRVYVTPCGLCEKLVLQRSSAQDILDESPMEAVRKRKFVPGKRVSTPVASWVTLPIEFNRRD